MASLGEVEAILIAALLTTIVALWAIITHRVVARRTETLNYFSNVETDKDIIEARNSFVEITSDGNRILDYADPSKYTCKEAADIRLVLNQREQIALGIQFGVLDKEYVRRYLKGALIRDFRLAAPFIYKVRAQQNNPAIYHEFEDLVRSLVDKKMPARWHWTRLWF